MARGATKAAVVCILASLVHVLFKSVGSTYYLANFPRIIGPRGYACPTLPSTTWKCWKFMEIPGKIMDFVHLTLLNLVVLFSLTS